MDLAVPMIGRPLWRAQYPGRLSTIVVDLLDGRQLGLDQLGPQLSDLLERQLYGVIRPLYRYITTSARGTR